MQNQTISQGKTDEVPFVLLDSVKKTGKDVAVETITLTLSKAGGPLAPVANPAISARGMGLYYWTPTAADTDTLGSLVYFASAPDTGDWRDMVTVVEPVTIPAETAHSYLVTPIAEAAA